MEAVENVLGQGFKTKDLGGSAGTVELTDKVCGEIDRIGKDRGLGKAK